MTTKLYVANVPLDATEDGLRAHFASCGGVSEVELLHDRQSGRPRGIAHVTMTSPSFASTALERLDGSAFNGARLRVSDAPVRADRELKPDVKIVIQFREKTCLVYDLDCAGVPLTLRLSADDDACSVEARSTAGEDAVIGAGRASTRREALTEALRNWNAASAASSGRAIDADAVVRVMLGIRAI